MKEIFLSYSRLDSSTVQALAAALEEKGVSVWIDRSGIEEGDAYDTQIEEAIARTRVVIVVWSQHSVRSHWVRAEAAYALNKHKLVPIAIESTRASRRCNSITSRRSISTVGTAPATTKPSRGC